MPKSEYTGYGSLLSQGRQVDGYSFARLAAAANTGRHVAPAKAGADNHRLSLLRRQLAACPKATTRGMGPCFRRDDGLPCPAAWLRRRPSDIDEGDQGTGKRD